MLKVFCKVFCKKKKDQARNSTIASKQAPELRSIKKFAEDF
jgi:hypothetical protein